MARRATIRGPGVRELLRRGPGRLCPPRLAWVPPDRLGDRPHVLVDGAPLPGTVLTLSHWPGTPTPPALRADLSTESAVLVRRRPALVPGGTAAVSTDHADEDATAAVAALTLPGLTDADAAMLVEVARVGDFAVVRNRRAALVAFALGAVLDPARTPVAAVAGGAVRGLAATGALVGAALERLPALLDDVAGAGDLWSAEAAAFDAAVAAVADGRVVVTDEPALDLAVVRPGPGGWPPAAAWKGEPVHRAAVHGASGCRRVATVDGTGVTVRQRYETWVRLSTPPDAPRVDLSALADELTALEGGGAPGGRSGGWRFDGVGALVPRLRWDGDGASVLDPDDVLGRLRRHLSESRGSPAAWDPYRAL